MIATEALDVPGEFEADYHRADKWRTRWAKLADTLSMEEKESGGRLQSKQEYIERRARLADIRCGNAIRAFHKAKTRKTGIAPS